MTEKNAKLDKELKATFPASDPPAASMPAPAAKRPTGPLKSDMTLIDPSDEQELRFWATELDVDVERVKQAIKAVGLKSDDVRRHIKSH